MRELRILKIPALNVGKGPANTLPLVDLARSFYLVMSVHGIQTMSLKDSSRDTLKTSGYDLLEFGYE